MKTNTNPEKSLQLISERLGITALSTVELLQSYAAIINELRARGVMRTKNNPVADYSEWLVSNALGLELERNSRAGYDAVGPDNTRYEIKGRRITPDNRSTQLSAIRNLEAKSFDFLIGIIFEADFSIKFAAKVPQTVVGEIARYSKHTNSHIMILREAIFDDERVENITQVLANQSTTLT